MRSLLTTLAILLLVLWLAGKVAAYTLLLLMIGSVALLTKVISRRRASALGGEGGSILC